MDSIHSYSIFPILFSATVARFLEGGRVDRVNEVPGAKEVMLCGRGAVCLEAGLCHG